MNNFGGDAAIWKNDTEMWGQY